MGEYMAGDKTTTYTHAYRTHHHHTYLETEAYRHAARHEGPTRRRADGLGVVGVEAHCGVAGRTRWWDGLGVSVVHSKPSALSLQRARGVLRKFCEAVRSYKT